MLRIIVYAIGGAVSGTLFGRAISENNPELSAVYFGAALAIAGCLIWNSLTTHIKD